ncbi:serine/arginine repetitive matrix protein 3-like [Lontra canadensis]|uniref:serine/arginine repetitive matrix protein 3-like n=1 Tax=Lontra canadensis TaxID=76717 RepID=UPI0013F34D13|nr:serine/arginine repetitive matrix protein 3-like [Lontra canadensis]
MAPVSESQPPPRGSRCRRRRRLVLPQLRAPGGARASRAEGGGRREGGGRWLAEEGGGRRGGETPRTPPGSTSSGSEQTRHKGGSRRSCQSAALPVTGVAPPPPPPPPPPQSPALPGPVCLGPVVQRGRRRRPQWRRREEARTAPARSRPRPAPPLAPGLSEINSAARAWRVSPRCRGQGGAGNPQRAAMAFLPHTHKPSIRARSGSVCVCLRESGHIFCPALANCSEPWFNPGPRCRGLLRDSWSEALRGGTAVVVSWGRSLPLHIPKNPEEPSFPRTVDLGLLGLPSLTQTKPDLERAP